MASPPSRAELYFSCDVETDGPIPGVYSMLSIGMGVCGRDEGSGFEPLDPELQTFYRELQPISEWFEPEALAVSGLDRARLAAEGAPPEQAMRELDASRVREVAGEHKPIFVAYPLGFDWSFAHYYLVRFAGGSPFGHAGHLDLKTLYAAKAGVPVGSVGKTMPQHLLSTRPHTHNALDDAIKQAKLLQNVMTWDGITSGS